MNKGMYIALIMSAAAHLGILALPHGMVTPSPPTAAIISITIDTGTAASGGAQLVARTHQRTVSASRGSPATLSGEMQAVAEDSIAEKTIHSTYLTDESVSPTGKSSDPFIAQSPAKPSAQMDLESHLSMQLQEALAAYFTYPPLARRYGWSGHVQISLRVEPDGSLSHLRLHHSSGHHILDKAALASLSRVGALPAAAGWLGGNYFDIVLPIEYRLTDRHS